VTKEPFPYAADNRAFPWGRGFLYVQVSGQSAHTISGAKRAIARMIVRSRILRGLIRMAPSRKAIV
jgi:hypothetical protein